MVDDGAMLWAVNDIHGDELCAEGEHVELGSHRLVSFCYLLDGFTLESPSRELEHGSPIFLCSQSQWIGLSILVWHCEHSHYSVALFQELAIDFLSEQALANKCQLQLVFEINL